MGVRENCFNRHILSRISEKTEVLHSLLSLGRHPVPRVSHQEGPHLWEQKEWLTFVTFHSGLHGLKASGTRSNSRPRTAEVGRNAWLHCPVVATVCQGPGLQGRCILLLGFSLLRPVSFNALRRGQTAPDFFTRSGFFNDRCLKGTGHDLTFLFFFCL